jgi:ribose transport system permease protein
MTTAIRKGLTRNDYFIFLGRYGTIICLTAMILIFSIMLPPFRSMTNVLNLMGQTALLAMFAAGMTCCMKMGDFDLSIGATAAITGIVVSKLLVAGVGMPVSIGAGILVGVLVGCLNGLLVAYVGLSAFVTTLATMSVIIGGAMAFTKGLSIWNLPKSFGFIGRGDVFGVPNRFLIAMVLLIVLWFIHAYTTTGRRMEAIGGNADAARLSGINVAFNRLLGFVMSGVCSAIAGIVLASALLSANSTQGVPYLMDAFGASFIGAATVRLGQCHIWGTFVGVLIYIIAVNGLIIFMVPGYFTDMIKGVILLLAIVSSAVAGRFIKG